MEERESNSFIRGINEIMNKNYNVLSFDLLQPEQLLQVLSNTLSNIEGVDSINIQHESLEATVLGVLEMLRILKYKIPHNISPSSFRQGLVQGDKKVIHPILNWLISNKDDLKKRSYLAKYLIKLEVPLEFANDPDISFLYEQYEARIEEFKAVHKESEMMKDTLTSVAELKSDIKAMESERESAMKKIEKLKRQTETLPDREKLLELAKELRLEREKRKEMAEHEIHQQNQLVANEQKLQRLSAQLHELRRNAGRRSPNELIRRLEEECSVNSYLAQQKLPAEISAREEDIRMYAMVLNEPSLTRAHLDDLNFKIQQESEEINRMMQAQLAEQSPGEDKNAPFRQQAAIIARKKEAKAEELSDIRSQVAQIEEELAAKQMQLTELAGEPVLRGDDLKKYVGKLRVKGAQYKKQKAQLSALKTEAGILTRTLEILSAQDPSVAKALEDAEGSMDSEIFYEEASIPAQDPLEFKTGMDRPPEEISRQLMELSRQIMEKKREVEPRMVELRSLREEHAETKDQYDQLKKIYDSTVSGLENQTSNLQQEVDKLQREHDETEGEVTRLQKEIEEAEKDGLRVEEEVKLYLSGSAEAKKESLRAQLQQNIATQEKVGKQLNEEQAALKEMQTKNAQQVRYWKDLERLFKCKLECLEDEKQNAGVVRRERGAETLILPQ